MGGSRFDQFAKSLVTRTDRRWVLQGGSATLAAILGATLGLRDSTMAKVVPEGEGQGQAKTKAGNHCISPSNVDLNERFGIVAQIVASFCQEVGAGEQWTVAEQAWGMAQTFAAVPEGFEPAGATPLEDFLAKFQGVTYVIDPGTRQEQTVFVPTSGALFVINADDGIDFVSPITLGTLHPLSVGEHVVEAYWVLSAMHCDGLAANPVDNCLAGESLFNRVRFKVTPGHN
jgi:hypothetical protein